MLEQPYGLLLDKLVHHVAQHRANRIEALVRLTDICQADIVEQDLLYDEDGDRLRELRARLHDSQTQRDDLRRQEEVDDLGGVIFDKGADNAKRGQTKVLKRAGFGGRVEERIEK